MSHTRETLHQPTDTIEHDGYRHLPGPEPYPPGSPKHAILVAELEKLAATSPTFVEGFGPIKWDRWPDDLDLELARPEISEIPNRPLDKTPLVPTSLHKRKERQTGTVDECPRAVRRWIEDGDKMQGAWLPCKSRTCGYCKEATDERDIARVMHSLGNDPAYLLEVDAGEWDKIRKRAQRAEVATVKMGTQSGHDRIVVVTTDPEIVPGARKVPDSEIVRLIRERPPGGAIPTEADQYEGDGHGHLGRKQRHRPRVETHLSGPGLISVREWEAEGSPGERVKRRTAKMSRLVTIETATICAEILGARVERHGLTVTVHAAWDSPAGVILRRWSKDPDGSLEWSRMLYDARTATGEVPTEEVPLEVYDRQLSLEAIA